MRAFMKSLNLNKSDLVILDRETGIGQVVFEEAQVAHLAVVVHADIIVKMLQMRTISFGTTIMTISLPMQIRLISLSYQLIDRMKFLQEQFAKYTHHQPKIVTIPVGSIDSLTRVKSGT